MSKPKRTATLQITDCRNCPFFTKQIVTDNALIGYEYRAYCDKTGIMLKQKCQLIRPIKIPAFCPFATTTETMYYRKRKTK